MKHTYIAMTTHNYQQNGMNIIIAAGNNKVKVKLYAEKTIEWESSDIYAETEYKNLVIVSKTTAKRQYKFDFSTYEPDDRYVWID